MAAYSMENIIAHASSSWPLDSDAITEPFDDTERQKLLEVVDRMSDFDWSFFDRGLERVGRILEESIEQTRAMANSSAIFASHDTDTTASYAGPVILPNDSDTTYATNIHDNNVPHTNTAWAGYEGYFPAMPMTSTANFGGDSYEHRADTETTPCTESSTYESIWRTPRTETMGVAVGDMFASGPTTSSAASALDSSFNTGLDQFFKSFEFSGFPVSPSSGWSELVELRNDISGPETGCDFESYSDANNGTTGSVAATSNVATTSATGSVDTHVDATSPIIRATTSPSKSKNSKRRVTFESTTESASVHEPPQKKTRTQTTGLAEECADHQAPRVRTSFCIEDALRTFASHKPSDEVFLAVLEQMKDPYAGLRGRDQIDRCGQTLFWDLQKRYLEAKPQPPANSMMDMLQAPGPMILVTLRTAAPPSKVEMYTEWLESSEFVLEAVERLLKSRIPGTRRRQTGLGRICFPLLLSFISQFIFQVTSISSGNHAGNSKEQRLHFECIDIQEAWFPAEESRRQSAREKGTKILERFDAVMTSAFDRFQKESGDKKKAAWKLKDEEKEFAKNLSALSEQGYGVGDSDVKRCGSLFASTSSAIREFVEDYIG